MKCDILDMDNRCAECRMKVSIFVDSNEQLNYIKNKCGDNINVFNTKEIDDSFYQKFFKQLNSA